MSTYLRIISSLRLYMVEGKTSSKAQPVFAATLSTVSHCHTPRVSWFIAQEIGVSTIPVSEVSLFSSLRLQILRFDSSFTATSIVPSARSSSDLRSVRMKIR